MATETGPGSSRALAWRRGTGGELWAEFFGAFILIAFGDGVVAMLWALFGSGRTTSAGALQSGGDWLLVTWGWGLAVMFAVYVTGGISGAHLNPAVTLAMVLSRRMRWRKLPVYVFSQFVGAALAGLTLYLMFAPSIAAY